MKQTALQFGLLILALFAFLQLAKYTLFTRRLAEEFWTVLFALAFLGLGLWLSRKFWPGQVSKKEAPDGMAFTKTDPLVNPEQRVKKLGISKREYEVLRLIAQGMSNQQIAKQLFISESTVKTHVSNLLLKLEAQRRTQAVSKAQKLGIL